MYMINKARQIIIYTQDSFLFFSKKKLPWVGFEPTTLRVLGECSTNRDMCRQYEQTAVPVSPPVALFLFSV